MVVIPASYPNRHDRVGRARTAGSLALIWPTASSANWWDDLDVTEEAACVRDRPPGPAALSMSSYFTLHRRHNQRRNAVIEKASTVSNFSRILILYNSVRSVSVARATSGPTPIFETTSTPWMLPRRRRRIAEVEMDMDMKSKISTTTRDAEFSSSSLSSGNFPPPSEGIIMISTDRPSPAID